MTWLADVVLACLLAEGAALLWLWRARGQGVPPAPLLAFLGAGVALALALRAALTGAAWHWVGLFLALAGLAHLAWLVLSWRRRDGA